MKNIIISIFIFPLLLSCSQYQKESILNIEVPTNQKITAVVDYYGLCEHKLITVDIQKRGSHFNPSVKCDPPKRSFNWHSSGHTYGSSVFHPYYSFYKQNASHYGETLRPHFDFLSLVETKNSELNQLKNTRLFIRARYNNNLDANGLPSLIGSQLRKITKYIEKMNKIDQKIPAKYLDYSIKLANKAIYLLNNREEYFATCAGGYKAANTISLVSREIEINKINKAIGHINLLLTGDSKLNTNPPLIVSIANETYTSYSDLYYAEKLKYFPNDLEIKDKENQLIAAYVTKGKMRNKWLRKAANQGSPEAMLGLGIDLINSHNTENNTEDYIKGNKWLFESQKLGFRSADVAIRCDAKNFVKPTSMFLYIMSAYKKENINELDTFVYMGSTQHFHHVIYDAHNLHREYLMLTKDHFDIQVEELYKFGSERAEIITKEQIDIINLNYQEFDEEKFKRFIDNKGKSASWGYKGSKDEYHYFQLYEGKPLFENLHFKVKISDFPFRIKTFRLDSQSSETIYLRDLMSNPL
ncbi:MAG: hypothetical protein MJK12_14730 [Colwellia sp.]|nr:hypothetical protein [Colwellia sp.]